MSCEARHLVGQLLLEQLHLGANRQNRDGWYTATLQCVLAMQIIAAVCLLCRTVVQFAC